MNDTPNDTADRAADLIVLSGNPDDAEVAALVAALAALSAQAPAALAPVSTLPAVWAGRERYTAPVGWAAGESRHLPRVA